MVDRSRIQVLDRAIDLLTALDQASSGVPLAELSRIAGVNRSTAYRILNTLVANRIVVRDEQLRYRLGFRLFELGSTVSKQDIAHHGTVLEHLHTTAATYGLTAFLVVREGDRALVIAQAVFGDVRHIAFPAGNYLALNLGAAPQVLLAHADPDDIDRIIRTSLTRMTVMSRTDPEELRAELAAIRRDGYAIADGDIITGVAAIGAPVHDARGAVLAAVSLSGLSDRMAGSDRGRIIDAVRAMAAEISGEFGWHGGGEAIRSPRRRRAT